MGTLSFASLALKPPDFKLILVPHVEDDRLLLSQAALQTTLALLQRIAPLGGAQGDGTLRRVSERQAAQPIKASV